MKEIYLSETSKRRICSGKYATSLLFFLFMLSFILGLLVGLRNNNYLLVLYNSVLALCCVIILRDELLFLRALITGRYKSFYADIVRIERTSRYASRAYWGSDISESSPVSNLIVADIEKENKVLVIQYANLKRKSFIYSKYAK